MKKIIASILIMIMALSSMAVFADSATILIDGKQAVIAEGMGSIVEKQYRTFVPVRFALEYFGYEVVWNEEDQSVFGRNDEGNIFALQVGSPILIFKGADGSSKTVNMDVTPFINTSEFRTYIPLRFLADVIGYEVGWQEATNTVTLDKK